MADTNKTLLALLLGAAAGATLGILFAPDSGANTRKKITDLKDQLGDEMGSRYEEGKSFVKDKVEAGKEAWNDLKSTLYNEADDLAEGYNNSTSNQGPGKKRK